MCCNAVGYLKTATKGALYTHNNRIANHKDKVLSVVSPLSYYLTAYIWPSMRNRISVLHWHFEHSYKRYSVRIKGGQVDFIMGGNW